MGLDVGTTWKLFNADAQRREYYSSFMGPRGTEQELEHEQLMLHNVDDAMAHLATFAGDPPLFAKVFERMWKLADKSIHKYMATQLVVAISESDFQDLVTTPEGRVFVDMVRQHVTNPETTPLAVYGRVSDSFAKLLVGRLALCCQGDTSDGYGCMNKLKDDVSELYPGIGPRIWNDGTYLAQQEKANSSRDWDFNMRDVMNISNEMGLADYVGETSIDTGDCLSNVEHLEERTLTWDPWSYAGFNSLDGRFRDIDEPRSFLDPDTGMLFDNPDYIDREWRADEDGMLTDQIPAPRWEPDPRELIGVRLRNAEPGVYIFAIAPNSWHTVTLMAQKMDDAQVKLWWIDQYQQGTNTYGERLDPPGKLEYKLWNFTQNTEWFLKDAERKDFIDKENNKQQRQNIRRGEPPDKDNLSDNFLEHRVGAEVAGKAIRCSIPKTRIYQLYVGTTLEFFTTKTPTEVAKSRLDRSDNKGPADY